MVSILKDASPILVLVVLSSVLAFAIWMFRRLVASGDKMMKEVVAELKLLNSRVGILENNDHTRQQSMSDGRSRFSELETANKLLHEKYMKVAETCVSKVECRDMRHETAEKLEAVSSRLDRIEDHLVMMDERWVKLSQTISDRFEPITRMLSEMIRTAGGS